MFNCKKVDGKWKIVESPEEVLNVLSCNMFNTLENFGDSDTNDGNTSDIQTIGLNNENNDNSEPVVESTQTVSEDQIDIESVRTLDDQVAVFITNNSQTVIDEMSVDIEYLDENGNTIDMDSDSHDMVLPGYTVVSKMNTPSVGFADATTNCKYSIGDHPKYENHSEDVNVEYNPGDGCVIVKITNNGSVSIDEVEFDVVLFKGDEIVTITYPEDISDVAPGATETIKVDTYNSKTYDSLEYGSDYDDIGVYLNQAHTFGY